MGAKILRSIMAAAVGMLIAFALIWLAQYAGGEVSPEVYDPQTGEIWIPVGSTIALFVGWFIGTFAGAWLAMRIAGGTAAGWVVAGAVVGAGLYRAITLADTWWVMAAGILIPLIATYVAERAAAVAAPASA
ncbi:MAG: hypothetical protein DI569_16140 [Sphingopyxis macrogoltabida]|uniref:Uncharacterized protein n=1 Tax=Sphingopyxis macrogoltabida TaxID=33050 RepID=A0A2W5MRA8_SPHMC|nr:MAG: hypothetical protein DI569_16140 [Sphingopyxis macrogoltabida]